MATLTNKQKEDLNKAIIEYLKYYPKSYAAFIEETGIKEADVPHEDILQKKWVSIIRLQKKVMELEEQNASLKEQMPAKYSKPTESQGNLPVAPEIKVLEGHRAPITHVNFHPIYTLVASSSEDGTIKIWDFESGKLEKTLKGHTETVNCTAFNKKGTILASCSADITIKIWSCDTFECTKTLNGHNHNVSSVCFLGEDKIISASRDKTLKIWEISTGYCQKTLSAHSEWVRVVSVNYTNDLIGSCSSDQSIIVWNATTGVAVGTLSEHTHVIECIQFACESACQTIIQSEYYHKGDGDKFIASGSRDKLIKIWDAVNLKCLNTLSGHDTWVRGLVFHPHGKYLLSCSDDKCIIVWDLMNGKMAKRLSGAHAHFITSIGLSSIYPVMATGSVDTLIKVWSCK
jgi:platelet-activating factor acetylhydrolase IB subunit alpha